MFRRLTQLGSRPYGFFLVALASLLFVHGVTSSLVQKITDCAQAGRIADIILLLFAFEIGGIWALQIRQRKPLQQIKQNRRLLVFCILLCSYSGWILLRGWQTHASLRETLLALLLDTVLFWVILQIADTNSPKTKPAALTETIVLSFGLFSVLAVLLYAAGLHQHVDSWLGYGQCGGETILRTGGTSGWLRTRGFARNPNELGALLVIPLLVAMYASLVRTTRYKNLFLTSVGSLVTLLALTFSRSALLAASVGSACLVLVTPKLRKALRNYSVALIAGALSLLTLGLVVAAQSNVFDQFILHKSDSSDSTSQHISAKRQGVEYIARHPWGSGPGSAGAVGAALQDGPSIESESALLDIGVQYGWLGVTFFMTLFILTLQLVRSSNSPYAKPVSSGLVGLFAASLVIPVWSNFPVTILTGFFVGLTLVAPKDTPPMPSRSSRAK